MSSYATTSGRCTLRNAEFEKVYFAELKLRKMLLLLSFVN